MMNTNKIQPIICCGGSGSRLWCLSTPKIPKHLISLGSKGTLLQETIRRISVIMDGCRDQQYEVYEPLLIMHQDHKLPPELSQHESNIVYEQYANDTAVAVAKAALAVKQRHIEDTIMIVFPADHYIYNTEAFTQDIVEGITKVTNTNIVLYGIEPTSPETKYGYIIPSLNGVRFREKPDANTALELIKQKALWNSGIFAANTSTVLASLECSSHNIMDWITNPRSGKAPSFDVAVLQEHSNIHAHYCQQWRWSDVGTWDAFIEIPEIKAEMETATNVITQDCSHVDVLNRGSGNIVIIGCKNLMVVYSGSDILIMPNTGDFNSQLKEIATNICK